MSNEDKRFISNQEEPLISIMVAVYNTEMHLEKCIESILNQTYKNIEVVLINDGSSDRSGQICDTYAKKDKRVKVLHKENGGLSDARNVGLEMATGEYFGFVDSDDWIRPEMIATLLNLCQSNKADIAQCEEFLDNNQLDLEVDKKTEVLNKREFMPLVLKDKITSHMWKNLYKKEMFEGIIFPKGYVAQDMMVFHKVANKANRIVRTNEKLYYYFADRQDNTSNSPKNIFKGTMCRALAFTDRYFIAIKKYPEVSDILLKKATRFSIASFSRVRNKDWENYNKEMSELFEFFHLYENDIMNSPNITLLEKISLKLILFKPKFFSVLSKMLVIK